TKPNVAPPLLFSAVRQLMSVPMLKRINNRSSQPSKLGIILVDQSNQILAPNTYMFSCGLFGQFGVATIDCVENRQMRLMGRLGIGGADSGLTQQPVGSRQLLKHPVL